MVPARMVYSPRVTWACAMLSVPVTAWSPIGHSRIARVANDILTEKQRHQVQTMLHGDLNELSDWEMKMMKKYPETDTLHWHSQDPEWNCGAAVADEHSVGIHG